MINNNSYIIFEEIGENVPVFALPK